MREKNDSSLHCSRSVSLLVALVVLVTIVRLAWAPRLSVLPDPWRIIERNPDHPYRVGDQLKILDGQRPDALLEGALCVGADCHPELLVETKNKNAQLVVAVWCDKEDASFVSAAEETWAASAHIDKRVEVLFFCGHCDETLSSKAISIECPSSGESPLHGVLAYIMANYSPLLVMRADVRSYIDTTYTLPRIMEACSLSECNVDKLWAGMLVSQKSIEGGSDEVAAEYIAKTGLSVYLPYMKASTYILSGALTSALVFMHESVGLKPFLSDELALASWLIPLQACRVNISNAFQAGSEIFSGHLVEMRTNVCKPKRPVLYYNLQSAEQVRLLHDALHHCNA